MTKFSLADQVTQNIITALERGVKPWANAWLIDNSAQTLPLRVCGTPYQGINVLLLWSSAAARGFTNPYWLTFKGALDKGGNVRKGEKGTMIVWCGQITKKGEGEGQEDETFFTMKPYYVFNAQQCENLPAQYDTPPPAQAPITREFNRPELDATFARLGATIIEGGQRAFYRPSTDSIHMPDRALFPDMSRYYATLAHEATHWTGHESRLDRLPTEITKENRAFEELVAEIGAAFLGAALDLPADHIEDHATYLDSWLRALKNDRKMIFRAAAQAQKAANFISDRLGLEGFGETMALAA